MPIFRVKSVKIYTGEKKFTRTPSMASVTNIRYVWVTRVNTDIQMGIQNTGRNTNSSTKLGWVTRVNTGITSEWETRLEQFGAHTLTEEKDIWIRKKRDKVTNRRNQTTLQKNLFCIIMNVARNYSTLSLIEADQGRTKKTDFEGLSPKSVPRPAPSVQ